MSYYSSISIGYNELYKEEQLNKLRIINENLDIKKSDVLLDVGCGTGFSLDFFGCECIGLEPERNLAMQSSKKIIIGNAENLPFEDDSFDVLISVTAIHNFLDVKKGLLEMKRVGKQMFAFSIMRKSKKFNQIQNLINELYAVKKKIKEDKDIIFII